MRISIAAIAFTLATACLFCGSVGAQDATGGKVTKAQGTPPNVITPKRHDPTLTPKPKTTPTSASGTPYSKQPQSLSKAHVSCTESCRAACSGPKKSKSACGPAYDSCVAAC